MKIGVIGVGSMGGMLVRAWLETETLDGEQLRVANRSPERLERLSAGYPQLQTGTVAEVTAWADAVWLCVPPGETTAALEAIGEALTADKLLVIITNTVAMAAVEARTAARVAKVIPTVTQEAWAGVALYMRGQRTTDADEELVTGLLAGIGEVATVQEHQGRTAADITSVGPAFLAYLGREMAIAAQKAQPDLTMEQALAFVHETMLGTALLLTDEGMTLDEVIARVYAPGSVTEAGLNELAKAVPQAWQAVFAATKEVDDAKAHKLGLQA